ncbi:DegT/DnrJ/EryC1/StrS family aminotransferase [Candidatus Nitrosotenuis cloacae]|uniref:DegT/DnrJ/EryC1/StrS family aminotransferase n=1 Tax=Candidatus Nitrosotenuis cloacae TaxID=1603555 RepID=UPI002281266E|nr:DegT/DnrJ/EryC1/StrS family aminotransferase [Candidatus Nitrosotenuis cloacae]
MKIKDAFNNNSIKVPFFAPEITNQDCKMVLDALKKPLLTDGPILRKFEDSFSSFVGSTYAVGVSNATSALHLSLRALGIGKGDEVIIPDMTFVATASSVILSGATPVLADINYDDLNISPKSIEKSLTPRTKAILPVHFAGKACDMDEIKRIARKNHLFIIEDCAHALGTKFGEKHVGTIGDVGCFSFYPTKNITTIEGGMMTTNSKKIANHVQAARNHGIMKSLAQRYTEGKPWEYDVTEAGYNYRLDEIRSALGLSQLKRLTNLNNQRRKICEYYNHRLRDQDGIITPAISKNDSCHLYILKIKKQANMNRDKLFKKLLKNGIRTSVHYKPLHRFSVLKMKARIYDKLVFSDKAYHEIISLPLYPQMPRKIQDKVIDCILQ